MDPEPAVRLPQSLVELYRKDHRALGADQRFLREVVSSLEAGDSWSVGVYAGKLSASLKQAFPALDFPAYHVKQFEAETFVRRIGARFREQLPLARAVLARLEALREPW